MSLNYIIDKKRIEVVFLKKGTPTNSTGLAISNPDLAAEVCAGLGIECCDDLILVSKASNDRLAALTTSYLMWRDALGVQTVQLGRIREARVNFSNLHRKGQTLLSANEISVVVDDGSVIDVPVESGGALSGFWNALIAIAKDNSKRST